MLAHNLIKVISYRVLIDPEIYVIFHVGTAIQCISLLKNLPHPQYIAELVLHSQRHRVYSLLCLQEENQLAMENKSLYYYSW